MRSCKFSTARAREREGGGMVDSEEAGWEGGCNPLFPFDVKIIKKKK